MSAPRSRSSWRRSSLCRLGLAGRRARSGRRSSRHGNRVLVHDQRRSGHRERRDRQAAPKDFWHGTRAAQDLRVWRFAFYYFFAFGAFVALALWLPRYLIGVYGFDIATAGMIGAALLDSRKHLPRLRRRALDRIGARTVHVLVFAVSRDRDARSVATLDRLRHARHHGPIAFHFEIGPLVFVGVAFVLGFFMSLGKAAVYKQSRPITRKMSALSAASSA